MYCSHCMMHSPAPCKRVKIDKCIIIELFFFFYRHVAIKEIILDPNKKNKTKEAVLKEARYHWTNWNVLIRQHIVFKSYRLKDSGYNKSRELLNWGL